jgi:hypothetical protein
MQTQLPIARRVLTNLNKHKIEHIQERLNKMYVIPPVRKDIHDMLYENTTAQSYHAIINDFLGSFIKYGEDFNNSNPLFYLDIFLGISTQPMVHYSTFLKENDEIEKNPTRGFQNQKTRRNNLAKLHLKRQMSPPTVKSRSGPFFNPVRPLAPRRQLVGVAGGSKRHNKLRKAMKTIMLKQFDAHVEKYIDDMWDAHVKYHCELPATDPAVVMIEVIEKMTVTVTDQATSPAATLEVEKTSAEVQTVTSVIHLPTADQQLTKQRTTTSTTTTTKTRNRARGRSSSAHSFVPKTWWERETEDIDRSVSSGLSGDNRLSRLRADSRDVQARLLYRGSVLSRYHVPRSLGPAAKWRWCLRVIRRVRILQATWAHLGDWLRKEIGEDLRTRLLSAWSTTTTKARKGKAGVLRPPRLEPGNPAPAWR